MRGIAVTAALAIACVLALAAPAALGQPAPLAGPDGTSLNKVLVIGTDGTRWDLLDAAMKAGRAPNLARLRREGFGRPSLLEFAPETITLSEVGWSSIASGVWEDKHGVDGTKLNMDPGQATKNGYLDFITRIENRRARLSTFLASDWDNIGLAENGGPIFGTAHDANFAARVAVETIDAWDQGDEQVTDAATRYLRRGDPDAGFVYLGLVDETAHLAGSATPTYSAAITTTDTRIGRLLRAIRSRPSLPFESWTIIVTTDHGQKPLSEPSLISHFGDTPLERTSFLLGLGARAGPGRLEAAGGGHPSDGPAPARAANRSELEDRRALAERRPAARVGHGRAARPRVRQAPGRPREAWRAAARSADGALPPARRRGRTRRGGPRERARGRRRESRRPDRDRCGRRRRAQEPLPGRARHGQGRRNARGHAARARQAARDARDPAGLVSRVARYGKAVAREGHGAELAERLLAAAAELEQDPGCELYLVNRQADDPDVVWVTELWRSQADVDASIEQIRGSDEVAAVMALVEDWEMIELEPLGGKGR